MSSEEVKVAFAAAIKAQKKRNPSKKEDFFDRYRTALIEIIYPALTDFTASPTVKLQLLLLEVSGDTRTLSLILKLGKAGVHRLEFSPDFAGELVSIRTVTPYGVEPHPPADLTRLSRTYIFQLAAAFILDSTPS